MHKTVDEALKQFSGDWVDSHRKLLSGLDHLLEIKDVDVSQTRKREVWREDKVRVFHYETTEPRTCPVPVLICYALVNRYYMMDLQENRSLIQNLLAGGLDIYIIDWGYPGKMDAHLTLEDYIDGYVDGAVDFVRQATGVDRINLLGVCQGGTFSLIYAATHAEKIRNLVTMVTPVDFDTDEGLLNVWARDMDVDLLVDTYGVVPGWFMNIGFLLLKPFQLTLDKYVSLLDIMDDRDALENFVRMEKWIFDSPGQAGEAFRKFLKDLYQENKLVKGELTLGGRPVRLSDIHCPVLNIFGTKDHLVPPSSSRPLSAHLGSTDVETFELPIGHIGMYVSGKSQKEIAPRIVSWLGARSGGGIAPAPGPAPAPSVGPTVPDPSAKGSPAARATIKMSGKGMAKARLTAEPTPGRPTGAKPAPGRPTPGRPAPGKPIPDRSAPGKPIPDRSAPGKPVQGRSTVGNPASGHPGAGRSQRQGADDSFGKPSPQKPSSNKGAPRK